MLYLIKRFKDMQVITFYLNLHFTQLSFLFFENTVVYTIKHLIFVMLFMLNDLEFKNQFEIY